MYMDESYTPVKELAMKKVRKQHNRNKTFGGHKGSVQQQPSMTNEMFPSIRGNNEG